MAANSLFKLLDLNARNVTHRQQLDCDAVIKEVQHNPRSAEVMYKFSHELKRCFPLHQAIKLRAPANVIDALHFSAAQTGRYYEYTTLQLALLCEAHEDVIALLLEKQPDAIRNIFGGQRYTPLHIACRYRSPLAVVSLLIDSWPAALSKKTSFDYTPLHIACHHNASLDVVIMLIERYPGAIMERNTFGATPFETAQGFGASENIQKLLFYVTILFYGGPSIKIPPNEMMSYFISIQWQMGILVVLDRYPTAKKKTVELHPSIMPYFLSMVGHRCRLSTMWEVIRNEQDLLAGV